VRRKIKGIRPSTVPVTCGHAKQERNGGGGKKGKLRIPVSLHVKKSTALRLKPPKNFRGKEDKEKNHDQPKETNKKIKKAKGAFVGQFRGQRKKNAKADGGLYSAEKKNTTTRRRPVLNVGQEPAKLKKKEERVRQRVGSAKRHKRGTYYDTPTPTYEAGKKPSRKKTCGANKKEKSRSSPWRPRCG